MFQKCLSASGCEHGIKIKLYCKNNYKNTQQHIKLFLHFIEEDE